MSKYNYFVNYTFTSDYNVNIGNGSITRDKKILNQGDIEEIEELFKKHVNADKLQITNFQIIDVEKVEEK